jgi:hypothetical protein
MAQIENLETQETVILNSHHPFGRNVYACNTFVNSKDVSRSHATIYWSNNHWFIQDHSRNGTLVNKEFIRKTVTKLDIGSQLQFGSADSAVWEITDVKPPFSYLKSLTSKNRILELESCHVLPDDMRPEIVFYRSENKNWMAETQEKTFNLTKGLRFIFNDEEWEFIENQPFEETLDYGQTILNAYFKLCISRDEEDIRVLLITENNEYDLGRRSYNYLLLALVRKRLADRNMGFPQNELGWTAIIELEKDISKELGYEIDAYYINLQIYRLRKQLMELKPLGHLLTNVIERRTGEIRFAFPQFKLIKDNAFIEEARC